MATDLVAQQGAVFRAQITIRNPDRTPIDLTGKTAHMQIMGREVLLDSDGPPGGIQLSYDRPNGAISVRIGADFTTMLSTGVFAYGLSIVDDSDATEVTPLLSGSFSVNYDGIVP